MFRAIFVAAICLSVAFPSAASILYVDNSGTPGTYSDLATAISEASASDTLMFSGSVTTYPETQLNKPLTFIGPGYFLTENGEPQANTRSASVKLALVDGCDGSRFIGMRFEEEVMIQDPSNNYIENLVFERCLFDLSDHTWGLFAQRVTDLSFIGCYFHNTYPTTVVYFSTLVSTVSFHGCFFQTAAADKYCIEAQCPVVTVDNCIFNGTLVVVSMDMTDSIVLNGSVTGTIHATYSYCDATQLSANTGVVQNVSMSSVFVGTGSTDGRWQILPGSAAATASITGDELGIFGGGYVLSGVPSVPRISSFTSEGYASPASGLRVQATIQSGD